MARGLLMGLDRWACPAQAPLVASGKAQVWRTVRGAALKMDVVAPRGAQGLPALLYLHGGAFRVGSRQSHRSLLEGCARMGFVVFGVDYRLAPEHPWPAAHEDAEAALAMVRHEGWRWGADPDRGVVLAGESAGAHLALHTAMRAVEAGAGDSVQGLLLGSGLYSLQPLGSGGLRGHFADTLIAGIRRDLLGSPAPAPTHDVELLHTLARRPEVARALPPAWVHWGHQDPLASQSRRLLSLLAGAGTGASGRGYPGSHAFHAFRGSEAAEACWADQAAWCRALRPAPASMLDAAA
jgi:acetyl esterase